MGAWARRSLAFRHVLWVGLGGPEEQSSLQNQAGVSDVPAPCPHGATVRVAPYAKLETLIPGFFFLLTLDLVNSRLVLN